jgi:uncharacterized protein YaaN involved in tellurite resistance
MKEEIIMNATASVKEVLYESEFADEVNTEANATLGDDEDYREHMEESEFIFDFNTPYHERGNFLSSIEQYGNATMQRMRQKNNAMSISISQLSSSSPDGGELGRGLAGLSSEMKKLDPTSVIKSRLFGGIHKSIQEYLVKYDRIDEVIKGIMNTLERGKKTLDYDIQTLRQEENASRELLSQLNEEIANLEKMFVNAEKQLTLMKKEDANPEDIKFMELDLISTIGRRLQDMRTAQASCTLSIITSDTIIRTNRELMYQVDIAKTVSITTLRSAAMQLMALQNQSGIKTSVDSMTKATEDLLVASSTIMKDQSVSVYIGTLSSGISRESLELAYKNTFSAIDSIDKFRKDAIPKIQENISKLRELAEKGQAELDKIDRSNITWNE